MSVVRLTVLRDVRGLKGNAQGLSGKFESWDVKKDIQDKHMASEDEFSKTLEAPSNDPAPICIY